MKNQSDIIEAIKNSPDLDAKVMWHLAKEGSDLSKPHEPDFAFSANNEHDAKLIQNILIDMGFTVSIYLPDKNIQNFEIVAVAIMILELDVLNKLSIKFEEVAKQFNGEYLGWGAEIVE